MKKLEAFKRFSPKKANIGSNKNAIVYTRVSTKDQTDNTSLESQLKFCVNYAKSNGLIIVRQFGGTHESAKTDDRKEFNRMLKYVKQSGSIGYIIVYSFDRFSRTGYSASEIADKLLQCGVQLVAVTQDVDATTPSGKFQRDLFFLFSQFDNELRRDKTITAMRELIRKGHWLWTPPRGYTNTKKYHKAVDWNIIVNDEGKLLKKAFKWKASNRYSNVQIITKLNGMGLKINERRLGEIFRNPFYCGILTSKLLPGEISEGNHEAIVSKSDFLKINSPKTDHIKTRKPDNDNLPLKSFIDCCECHKPLTGFLVKRKKLFYYKCRTKGCIGTKSADQLHELFLEKLSSYRLEPKYAEVLKDVMTYTYDQQTNELRENEAKVKKQLTIIKDKIESIEERFAIGEIDARIFEKYSTKFTKQKVQLEEQLKDSTISSSNLSKAMDKAIKMSTKLSKLWVSGNLVQKSKLQKLVFPDGMAYDKQTDKVQTKRVNSIFAAIPLISDYMSKKKNGEPIDSDKFSARVTTAGFKPATAGAEIQCSIQLSYVALDSCIRRNDN